MLYKRLAEWMDCIVSGQGIATFSCWCYYYEEEKPCQGETQITKRNAYPNVRRRHRLWRLFFFLFFFFKKRGVSKVDKSSFDCETLFTEYFISLFFFFGLSFLGVHLLPPPFFLKYLFAVVVVLLLLWSLTPVVFFFLFILPFTLFIFC